MIFRLPEYLGSLKSFKNQNISYGLTTSYRPLKSTSRATMILEPVFTAKRDVFLLHLVRLLC